MWPSIYKFNQATTGWPLWISAYQVESVLQLGGEQGTLCRVTMASGLVHELKMSAAAFITEIQQEK